MASAGRVDGSPPPLGGPGFDVVTAARDLIAAADDPPEGARRWVVGVSGGPDSICLLDVLGRLAGPLDLELEVAHVDHGLAPDSEEVAAAVARAASGAGHDVHVARAAGLEGPNLHARARDFRYRFFETVADETGAARIVTAHTLDDRVETTLARLIHGAGTDGLAGLRPRDGKRLRPLLGVRRVETRAYCLERGLEFVDDPANEDDRFDRAAVRTRVLAAIEERWGDGAVRAMGVSSERLAEDADFLKGLAETLYGQIAKRSPDQVRFALEDFRVAPRALRRRLLERAVGRVRDRSGGIDAALDALDRVDREPSRLPLDFDVAEGAAISVTREDVVVKMPR
ncbi:MAG TPA: tRNA lysidine(34) synthetase TilS [Actinomycetota bacterium]|nr:tRNA lysidine(34) synthetase TilS [Actinomycetota bacterium]